MTTDNQMTKAETKPQREDGQPNVHEQKITRPKELYLLFWIDEPDSRSHGGANDSKTLFSEAAQTRMKNIKNAGGYNENIHKVHCPPIQSLNEINTIIANWTAHYGGKDKIKTKEIGVFSHSGTDGPITYYGKNNPAVDPQGMQLAVQNGWSSIEFNWGVGARCVFYGCNSGYMDSISALKAFAQNLSSQNNFKGVYVWGQSTYSFPSLYPDYRVTSMARTLSDSSMPKAIRWLSNKTWDILRDYTYMVAGKTGQGFGPVSFSGDKDKLTPEELKKFPAALPMHMFVNGTLKMTTNQGLFNDHRNNKS